MMYVSNLAALQVVVDAIDPRVLVSECATRAFNFDSIDEKELHEINIPLSFQICKPSLQHTSNLHSFG